MIDTINLRHLLWLLCLLWPVGGKYYTIGDMSGLVPDGIVNAIFNHRRYNTCKLEAN
jgi:hypothetical protein